MGIHHTPLMNPCPWCAKPHTGQVGERYPEDGDISICTGCLNPSLIEAGPFGMTSRRVTAAEQARWAAEIAETVAGCREFVRRCHEEGLTP